MARTPAEVLPTAPQQAGSPPQAPAAPALEVGPSPHLGTSATTATIMRDVLIGLTPVMVMSVWFFGWAAIVQVGLCVLTCLGVEAALTAARGRSLTIMDGSAAITGVILGLSLPWSSPWYVAVIGAAVAIGLGKWVFGGLGFNIFNPAMVGRAFVMLSFAAALGASAFVDPDALGVLSQATPLAAAKEAAGAGLPSLTALLAGAHNGSLGETSILAALLGGAWLIWRRAAVWQIPAAVLAGAAAMALACRLAGFTSLTVPEQLFSGALVFGAFFIATDPVTSPITPRGRWIFGVGIGVFVVMIRVFSSYPGGVMFAVLIMNAAVPVINRWTIPQPLGWRPKPQEAKA